MAALNPTHGEPVRLVPSTEAPAVGPLAGEPSLLGLPSFIVGSVALGLMLIGVVTPVGPFATTGSTVPVVIAAAGVGMLLTVVWAAALGQSMVASIYGIFGGFYLSYAVLSLGLQHAWFGIIKPGMTAAGALHAVAQTQKLFVITWIVIVSMLLLASIRLPVAYVLLIALVDVSFILNLVGIINSPFNPSAGVFKAAGYVALVFSAIGAYLFIGAANHATGAKKAFPVGRPILHG